MFMRSPEAGDEGDRREAIDQEKVDAVVRPVGRRREGGRDADLAPADPDAALGWGHRLGDAGLDGRPQAGEAATVFV
jgi:hypothetical protein